jgi:hypothetical protein
MLAGTIIGDWMHTSQVFKLIDAPADAAWLKLQQARAWRFAEDVLEGWGDSSGVASSDTTPLDSALLSARMVGDGDDAANDDGGVIPAGGAKIATEYGLWGACVWSKTFSQVEDKTRETFSCRTYADMHEGLRISDDEAGRLAPTPSSDNFGAAQGLSIVACVGSCVGVIACAVVMFLHGNAESPKRGELLLGAEFDEEPEDVDNFCTTGGVPFPTTGLAGRLAVVSAVGLGVSAVASFAAIGAWVDSPATTDLQRIAAATDGAMSFSLGSSVWMMGLGGGFALVQVLLLGLGYFWFREQAPVSATQEEAPADGAGQGAGQAVGTLAGQPAGKGVEHTDALDDDDGKV